MKKTNVEAIKRDYQKGERVKLFEMVGESMPRGLEGTVEYVDDNGQIHVRWDNGSGLALNLDVDNFCKVETHQTQEESDMELKDNEIDVVIVRPNQAPVVERIKNELKSFQEIVSGYIEVLVLDEEALLICNEEGKLIGLEGNRRVGNDIIAGSFLVVGSDGGEEFLTLTPEQLQKYCDQFMKMEEITQEEVENAIMIQFRSW